jgi:hypothetical protein
VIRRHHGDVATIGDVIMGIFQRSQPPSAARQNDHDPVKMGVLATRTLRDHGTRAVAASMSAALTGPYPRGNRLQPPAQHGKIFLCRHVITLPGEIVPVHH